MGAVIELRTRPDRLREDQASVLRQALLPFAEQMPDAVQAIIGHIDRQTASRNRWTFVMLSPTQNAVVVNYLAKNSQRPLVALRLWAMCFEHLQVETGEVMLRRDQLAKALGETADHVSAVMSELVTFGAIIRNRERVAGLRGPGLVRYYMNPRVATHLAGRERDDAQEAAPPLLKLIEGGQPKA